MSEEVQHKDHDEAHEREHLLGHARLYWKIFWWLILGTFLTVFVPKIWHFEVHSINIFIGLLIATVKASLVSLFFMHLNAEKKLIYSMIGLAVFGALALFILTALAYWDHPHSSIW